jgi:hypothetical protein
MTVMGNHEAGGGFAEYSVRFQSAAVRAADRATLRTALSAQQRQRYTAYAAPPMRFCGRSVHFTALIVRSAVGR